MSGTLDAVTLVPTAGTDDASSKPGRHTNGHEDSAGDRWRRLLTTPTDAMPPLISQDQAVRQAGL
jgi:hypothetical protein